MENYTGNETGAKKTPDEVLLSRGFMALEDGDFAAAEAFFEQSLNTNETNANAYLGKLMAQLKVRKKSELAAREFPFDGNLNYQKALRFAAGDLKKELEGYIETINGHIETARKESDEKSREAAQKAAAISGKEKKKRKRIAAIAIPAAVACIAFVIVLITVIIPKQKYNKAMGLLDSGDYEAGYAILEELGKNEEILANKNDRALALIDSGDYEAGYALLKELGKSKVILKNKHDRALSLMDSEDYEAGYAILEELGKSDEIAANKYERAVKLIDSEDYNDAYTLLDGLNYKDSAEKAAEILFPKQKSALTDISIGSTIKYGSYEQDNNTLNGKEEIEWIVLAKENNKVLVISKYALDCQPYNTYRTDITWKTCTLRSWLNETFYNTAFGTDHQRMIVSSTVTADKNPTYSISPGNDTTDKVFLLSITEAYKYFSSDNARVCAPTDYAIAQGAYTNDSYKTDGRFACWWWLRSPGCSLEHAAVVYSEGSVKDDVSVFYSGQYVDYSDKAVRPAIWIYVGS